MILRSQGISRTGTMLPLMAITLVGLMGFVALAVDVGVMMVASTQCQGAADAAALAGARSLDGNAATSNNKNNAVINAKTAAEANWLLSQQVQDSQVSVTVGKYYYKPSTSAFVAWPVDAGSVDNANEPWTLISASVSLTNASTFFGNVLGDSTFSTSASAVAVHHPRDVVMIVDLSGSMRFDSLLGVPLTGNRNQSMNPETVYPLFGHYSATSSAALAYTTNAQFFSGEIMGAANDVAVTTSSGYSVVNDFYQDATAYGTTTPAFTSAGDGDAVGWVAGDQFLKTNLNQGASYAKTVQQILNTTSKDSSFETNGYEDPRFGSSRPTFATYVQGPRYWGKTFFIWPPDPRPSKDWRKLFFFKKDGVTPLDDNSLLWDSGGNWEPPNDGSSDQYRINYTAMNSRMLINFVVLGFVLGVSGQVKADIIYTNIGPGADFDPTFVFSFAGSGTPIGLPARAVALEFNVPAGANFKFTSATAALGLDIGTNEALFSLETDATGVPGTILESIDLKGQMGLASPGKLITANSVLNPLLLASTPYWLVLSAPASDTAAGWHLNSIGDTATLSNRYALSATESPTGPWTSFSPGNIRPAFEIDATPAVAPSVPEPATLTLLGIGLSGLMGFGWRRRKLVA